MASSLCPVKLFLTGPPGSGKTTAVLRLARLLTVRGYRVGGFVTLEVREGHRRVGFDVLDLATNRRHPLARVGRGPLQVSRYAVYPEGLAFARQALERACRQADVVLMDEIGPMELLSHELVQTMASCLRQPHRPVVGTLHYRTQHPLAQWVRKHAEIFEVTPERRDQLPDHLLARLLCSDSGAQRKEVQTPEG